MVVGQEWSAFNTGTVKISMNNKRFFCVRGFMKSGTNWLGSLLNSHEEISCNGEFHWQEVVAQFNKNLQTLPLYRFPDYQEKSRQHFEEFIRRTMIDRADPEATVIGDRTPHTIVPVALRNVPYISIIRDGRDILVSRVFHLYNVPEVTGLFDRIPAMAETFQKFKQDPWHFQKHPEELLCHEEVVRTSVRWWRDHLKRDEDTVTQFPKLKVRFVKYEDLHRDTVGERKKLFEFLDVDPKRAAKLTGDLKPGFKKERPSEFNRKGAVGDWKNYFTDQSKQWFKEEGGETLIQYGYEASLDW